MHKKIERLKRRQQIVLRGGGEAKIQQQKEMGKLFVRDRINVLLDKDTLTELFMFAEHQCHEFGMEQKRIPGARPWMQGSSEIKAA